MTSLVTERGLKHQERRRGSGAGLSPGQATAGSRKNGRKGIVGEEEGGTRKQRRSGGEKDEEEEQGKRR